MKHIFLFFLLSCLSSLAFAASAFSATQKDDLLFGHNKARREKGLPDLQWDDAVAQVAQNWADTCKTGQHSRGQYGENIAWGGGLSVIGSNKMWIDGEYGDWKCGEAIRDGPNGNYDHYTQVVWETTTHVGCGIKYGCAGGDFIVCNFNPPGNYLGSVPYPASKCNNVVACTPDSTCARNNNADFTDSKCGLIKCGSAAASTSTVATTATSSRTSSSTSSASTRTSSSTSSRTSAATTTNGVFMSTSSKTTSTTSSSAKSASTSASNNAATAGTPAATSAQTPPANSSGSHLGMSFGTLIAIVVFLIYV